ncbi:MAG TPA: hypothetical protein VI685_20745 [Candidatus Angelobacter sp.]
MNDVLAVEKGRFRGASGRRPPFAKSAKDGVPGGSKGRSSSPGLPETGWFGVIVGGIFMAWPKNDTRAVELFWEALRRLEDEPEMKRLGFGCDWEYPIKRLGCRFDARLWTGVYPPVNRIPMDSASFAEVPGVQHFKNKDVMDRDYAKALWLCDMERPLWVRSDFEIHRLAERNRLLSSLRNFALDKQEKRNVLYSSDGQPIYIYGKRVCYYQNRKLITRRSKEYLDSLHERWYLPSTYKLNPFYRIEM